MLDHPLYLSASANAILHMDEYYQGICKTHDASFAEIWDEYYGSVSTLHDAHVSDYLIHRLNNDISF